MNRRVWTVVGALVWGVSARGAFLDPLWSARAAALGGAMTALSDGPSSVFYNPAGLIRAERPSAEFTYARLLTGLDDVNISLNQFAYSHPLRSFQALSVGWGRVGAADLRREDTFLISYSRSLREIRGLGDLAVAASLRGLQQTYELDPASANDPVFRDGRSRMDAALDLHGHLENVAEVSGLSAGLSLRGVNRPDVGFGARDLLPLETALGVAYLWGKNLIPLDVVVRRGELTPQIGIERRVVSDRLWLRAGTDTDSVGAGMGYKVSRTSGFSFVFDYAFLWALDADGTSGSHRATVGVRF